ncbi:SPOR domain-containing protein [Frateuria terrea]|uniref:Sporulation related domain-containing protein n=1 Tax=Frateuria terrea TaxID=529704 RepID=A0A1H6VTS7_9GAMM|nr:SPOR domain-containing protein [Frateuria terrea]SEJ03425.1 Sporulation related domain-containing protein [Frateuria terrea]SFP63931.1 Sporulation related domain-containing protein [Frateuria terrea]
MFLRLLFVLLVALNIAVGAWLMLGQDDAHGRSVTDPGVPMLHLLSEQSAAPVAGRPPVASTAPAQAASAAVALETRCLAIGPFGTPQDLRTARGALAGPGVRMRSRQEQATETGAWWVYLPAPGTRAQALALARRLDAAHVGDYFVMSSGDQSNAISLGLFKDPANARKRRDEVAAAGFAAQIQERTEQVPEYWLDLVVADGARLDWRGRVRTAGVGSHSTSCF